MAGTVDRLAIEVARLLEPIRERLAAGQVVELFSDLGLPLSPAVGAAVGGAASSALNALLALPAKIAALVDTVRGDDEAAVAAALAELLQVVPGAYDASRTLAGAVRTEVTAAGPVSAPIQAILNDLPQRLINFSIVTYLLEQHPALGDLLALFGLIDNVPIPPDGDRPGYAHRRPRLDRLGTFMHDPLQALREVYGWGDPATPLNEEQLFGRLRDLLSTAGVPATVLTRPDGRHELAAFFFRLVPVTGAAPGTPTQVDLVLDAFDFSGLDVALPFGASWAAHLRGSGTLNLGTALRIEPPATVRPQAPAPGVAGEVTVSFERSSAGSGPLVLLGSATASRLIADSVHAAFGVAFAGSSTGISAKPAIDAGVTGGKLVIDASDGDGFVATLLGGTRLEAGFDVAVSYDPDDGLRFRGSGGLEIQLPVHLELGPLEVQSIYLAARVDGPGVAVELSVGFRAELGPIQAAVDRIGLRARLTAPPDGGNLGPADVAFAFKPPNGVGLALDAGLVAGGGYLYADPDRGEYAGALELEFAQSLALKAIGLISTRMPDGSTGFSLLVVITAEFGGGGIQLGYGFTLLAVGGILGLNRGMNLAALVEGVRTGSIESIMFPRDVVANAPRILSDLRAFFPPEQGTFLIGPMAKIGWGTPTLVSVSLGVIVEIPGNIAILGVLKVVLPTEQLRLLVLQVQFVGAIELDKQRLWFFAQLFDSRILTMTLSGGIGLLVGWGDNPDFVLTVGGFHPSYKPPPLPFPVPGRLSVDIANQPGLLIRVSGYFAVTSNTVQFGARAELRLGFSDFGIEGHLSFDALFQLSPFRFVISISASLSLKAFGVGLFSIDLQFQLEGPSPWRAHGRGSIGFLFFEISADFDITWGEARDTTLPPVDVLPLLAAEVTKVEGWQTRLPAGRAPLVTLRTLPPTDQLVLHPLGTLVVRQRAIPLDVRVDRVGGQRARDGKRFSLAPAPGSGLVQVSVTADRFAMAQFQDLSDAAKLSLPAYGDQDAGLELAGAAGVLASARVVRRSARYEAIVLDSRGRAAASLVRTAAAGRPRTAAPRAAVGAGVPAPRKLTSVSPAVFGQLLAGSSTGRSVLSRQDADRRQPFAAADTVRLPGQRFVVAYVRNNLQAFPPSADGLPTTTLAGGAAAATFRSQAAAADALADWVVAVPALAGTLHVIPAADAAAPLAVPGGWSAAGALPAATAWTTPAGPAVLLTGGRVLVAGGADGGGAAVAATALFDPVGNLWSAGPPLGAGRHGHATTLLGNDRVLVSGGLSGPVAAPTTLASAETYDPVSGTWSAAAALHTPRAGHSATRLRDGRVLVAGGTGPRGSTGHAALASTEIFDPATGWATGAAMTAARSGHQAVLLPDDRVLVIGGIVLTGGPPATLAYCELFDPATGSWTPTGELATARAGHQATLLPDGTVLVTGGDRAGLRPDGTYDAHSLDTAERYDPATGRWVAAARMPGPRARHRSILLRTGQVLLTGGTGGPAFTAGYRAVAMYDPGTDGWSGTGALAGGRWAHAVAELADGRVVVAGGIAAGGPAAPGPDAAALTAGTEVFTP
jgi:hypothetical protein